MKTKSNEMVHSDKYADAIKIAQKFTSKNDFRMILKFVNHKENGDLMATDSHHLILLKNAHGFRQDYMVNPRSLEFFTGNYPDFTNLFPTDYKAEIKLNESQIKIWHQMHRSMNQMSKLPSIHSCINMKIGKGEIEFSINQQEIAFKLPFEELSNEEEFTISYNVEYMRNALEAHAALKSKEIIIGFSGFLKPFVLDNNDDLKTVVLPVRVN